MKVALEFDDFSPRNSNLHLLEQMKEHYPDFKVTLFTVPWEIRFGQPTPITEEQYSPWVKAIKKNEDWMEIALHGLTHMPEEFGEISYEGAKKRIITGENMFKNRGIKLAKIFKAPCWSISKEAKQVCADLGFKVVEDHYYNWNLKDDFPSDLKEDTIVIGHGHIQKTMGNGLEEVIHKLMKLPPETKFIKLSEIL